MPKRTLTIDPKSPLHELVVRRLESRIKLGLQAQSTRHDKWARAEELVLAYVPESEADSLRRASREHEGKPRYTTIMLPYTYALLMSAHTYWTSVYFARSPVHQFVGLHGETEMQIQALEALIQYQVEVGELLAPYYLWLYDAGKYGLGILGVYWCEDTLYYGSLVEMDLGDGKGPQLFQTTEEVPGYRGNRVYNVSPYDFIPDPRIPITKFQDGEFCAVRKRLGWYEVVNRARDGYYMNIEKLASHTGGPSTSVGSGALVRPETSQFRLYETNDIDHPAAVSLYEVYITLIPSEWDLGDSIYPQKWCFTITEDCELLIGATPLGYLHCKFPFDVLEPEVEGYGLYNRGIPEIMEGIQNTMDWLINTHFFNVRAALNNQFIVDPSKLVIKDIANSHEPGFIWRLRPEAYGSDISRIFQQVPVSDVTRQHLVDLQNMLQIGERTLGINDSIMGVLAAGGRKTATEVRTSTGFGVSRQKTIVEYMSAHGFASHARKLVQNSQQYFTFAGKLRIVGDLLKDAGPQFMEVTPELIAGYFAPLPVDGTLPVDRIAQANLWKEILIGASRLPPTVLQNYDFSKIFAWMASLGGLKNIHQMKVQVMPNETLANQAAAGNVVPILPRASKPPGFRASAEAGLNAMNPIDQVTTEGLYG